MSSARSHLSPGQELPSAAEVVRHCSPYPLDGISLHLHSHSHLHFHPLHLSRPHSLTPLSLRSGGRLMRCFLVAHIRRWASDRTPELVPALLLGVYADEPPSNRTNNSRCIRLYEPRATARLSPTGKSDERGAIPRTLIRLVRPLYRVLSVSEGQIEWLGNNAPKPKPGPSRLRIG